MKLHSKIALFMTAIVVLIVGGVGLLTFYQVEKTIEAQMGSSAMDLGVTIAAMAPIQARLGDEEGIDEVQAIVEGFRKKTRFQYIIVMDMKGIKYSYPIEHGLGKKYISGGEEKVLTSGTAYISEDKNVLFSAFRAFVPIHNSEGEQVGAVVVGLLTDKVYEDIQIYIITFWATLLVGMVIGIIAAGWLSMSIKRSIYGLEPKEIALLLGQRDNILQSLNHGIVAVDQHGDVLLFNKIAEDALGLKSDDIGKSIYTLEPSYRERMLEVMATRMPLYGEEVKVKSDTVLLCNYTPFFDHKGETIGVVNSFHDLTEVRAMAEELTGIKKMAYSLRAQNHEFMNKLHTISGLIQLESYEEALDYIDGVVEQREEVTEVLTYKIKVPYISAILLAKYNKATEAKIVLTIEPDTYLDKVPSGVSVDEVCSILGNLIDNAIDALVPYDNGVIGVYVGNGDEVLKIRVSNNGPAIDPGIKTRIFKPGVTTKEGNRGTGMNIVKNIVDRSGGHIDINEDNGVVWNISIPM